MQNDVLPMGSPLLPILAQILMDNLEYEFLSNKNPFIRNDKFLHRYVDDVLSLFIGSDRQLDAFLTSLNSIIDKIICHVAIGVDQSINFLYLSSLQIKNIFKT